MDRSRAFVALCTLVFLGPSTSAWSREDLAPEPWVPLFNGIDLSGWTPKFTGHALGENLANTFRVEDGLLKVSYDGYERFDGKFGHLFHERSFRNYRLRVEYRFAGSQVAGAPGWAFKNSGVMLHGQSVETMGRTQNFPVSIEVQLLGGRAEGRRPTANLCTPGTHVVMDGTLCTRHCVESNAKTIRDEAWTTVEVEVLGNRIRHFVDGDPVLEYLDPQLDEGDADAKRLMADGADKMLREGTISLQAESHPVHFRKIEIQKLPEPGPWLALLAGDDLAEHWETTGNWHLKDGVVTLTPRPGESGWQRYGAYLWSKAGSFEHFEAEFEYQVQKGSNSGFYFHVGDTSDPVRTGLEVQIFDSHGKTTALNDHDAGGVIPGVPPRANAARAPGAWNRFRIQCLDNTLTVELNGVIVNRVALDRDSLKDRPRSGRIGFQDHALPLSIRNLRIRRL